MVNRLITYINVPIYYYLHRIIDIAANWESNVSAAMTENFEIYVWGIVFDGTLIINNFEKMCIREFHNDVLT